MPRQQRSNAGQREHGVGAAGKEGWKQAACGLGCLEGIDRCSAVRTKEFGGEIRGEVRSGARGHFGLLFYFVIIFCFVLTYSLT